MRLAPLAEIQQPSTVFWAHGDSALASAVMKRPYATEDLRHLLNYYGLFTEHLCILDICLLNNAQLGRLIMQQGYDAFISNSIIVPLLRSSLNSFQDLQFHFADDPTAYVLLDPVFLHRYAEFLDDLNPLVLRTNEQLFTSQLASNLECGFFDSALLQRSGLAPVRKDLDAFTEAYYRKTGRSAPIRRSLFFFFADELVKRGHPRYASRVRLLSSAIYNNTFCSSLGFRPAFPHTYVAALLKILDGDSQPAALNKPPDDLDPQGLITLSDHEIHHLTPRDILNLRTTDEAKNYFSAMRSTRDAESACTDHVQSLLLYLDRIQTQIALVASGRRLAHRRAATRLKIARWASPVGGFLISLGILGLALPSPLPGILAGLAWGFGNALYVKPRLRAKVLREEHLSNQEWRRMRDSLERQPVIGVTKPALGTRAAEF